MSKHASKPVIRIKRVQESAGQEDGVRVLVDRLWPRGVTKEGAHVDAWFKEVAPSDGLRTWFGHAPARWEEFRRRYGKELERHEERLAELAAMAGERPLTLVYAAKDTQMNNAVVLRDFMVRQVGRRAAGAQAGLLLSGWRQNAAKVRELMGEVTADNMTMQPEGVVNHPAWTLAHLIHYHPAIFHLALGEAVEDPALEPNAAFYDEGSTPVADTSVYPTRNELLNHYLAGHVRIEKALAHAPESLFAKPPGLARWTKAFATTGDALVYLMLVHESQHVGQMMVWRRAMSQAGVCVGAR